MMNQKPSTISAGISINWMKMKIGTSPWIGHDVCAKHTGNGSARTDARHVAIVVQDRMDDSGAESAQHIKQKESKMSKPVFHVVAEDPQVPHVADQVKPASMQEHGCKKWHNHSRERQIRLRPREDGRRHDAIMEKEAFEISTLR
jgi:hypothetical protein